MSQLTMFEAWGDATSSPASAGGTSPSAMPAGPTTAPSGPAPARASRSRSRGGGAGSATTATSGPRCSDSSPSAALQSVLGEQVASRAGRGWLAGVRADLEALGYAVGAADLCAAGEGEEAYGWIVRDDGAVWKRIVIGAPHIRQRLFWVADDQEQRQPQRAEVARGGVEGVRAEGMRGGPADDRGPGGLGDPADEGLEERQRGGGDVGGERPAPERAGGDAGGLGDSDRERQPQREERDGGQEGRQPAPSGTDALRPGGGFWSRYDIVPCRDGKARRVEPGVFPLAPRLPPGLGALWAKCVRSATQEIIRHVEAGDCGFEQAVRMVRDCYGAEALRAEPEPGMPVELPPAAFLLDFLFYVESARIRAAHGGGGKEAGTQDPGDDPLRGLRSRGPVRRPSRRRPADEQRPRKSPESVPELSRLLARCAQPLWEATIGTDAAAVPMSLWPVGRVGMLRGYGNAIVPQVAARFIRAFLESERRS
jgi:DNA (cytosine-5)-methyltransferase 1